jgi:CubicO group peptidase (beta-lactamase class C family)
MTISRRATLGLIAGAALAPTPAFAAPNLVAGAGGLLPPTALDNMIRAAMAKHAVPGASLALINSQRIAHLRHFGVKDVDIGAKVSGTTVFEAASLSKPVFSEMVMAFVQSGRLSLDAPLADVLPLEGLNDPRAAKISARMVLTHMTGLPNWRRDNKSGALDLAFDPGAGFRYSGEGFEYLARVMQRLDAVDARGLERMFQRTIARPAGMRQSQFVLTPALAARRAQPHRNGKKIAFEVGAPDQFGAAYALHTTAEDYAKWLVSVMRGRGPLRMITRDLWLSAQNVPLPANHPDRAFGLSDWALGFQIYQLPFGRLHMHGGSNQGFTCLAGARFDAGWGFALFTNADQAVGFLREIVPPLLGLSIGQRREPAK